MTGERKHTEEDENARPMRPGEFRRRLAVTAGFAALLYLFLRFALPAFLPLLFGWLISRPLLPVVRFLRRSGVSEKLVPAAASAILFLPAGALICGAGKLLQKDLTEFACACPGLWKQGSARLAEILAETEGNLNLPKGILAEKLEAVGENFCLRLADAASSAGETLARLGVLLLFTVLAVFFWTKEGGDLTRRMGAGLRRIPGYGVVSRIVGRACGMGKCYLRCECRVAAGTCAVCAAGLWLLRVPHAVQLGLLIGFLDTLPLLGTGTVLFPWALFSFLAKRFGLGLGLIALCLVCTLLRQFQETGCFGCTLGTSSLESLAAMYAGWKWLGLAGLFLGPLSWLLIREVWKESESIVKSGK